MAAPASAGKPATARTPETMQPAVLYKLVLFAFLMAFVPIATYFGTLSYVFDGSTTGSAISAIIAANFILVGYVVVAFKEDIPASPGAEAKKSR
ncbi:hypothetical protein IAT38_002997 [Cryptococcus sp. DSM 104549]